MNCLCSALELEESVRKIIWNLLVELVMAEWRNKLIYQRHIDQIILCAVYGAVKMLEIPFSFRELVNCYMRQPQAASQVCHVLVIMYSYNVLSGNNTEYSIE